MGFFSRLLGGDTGAEIKRLNKLVAQMNELETAIKALSDAELRGKTAEFKARLADGATLDDILPEAFAVVREAGVRTVGMRHFDVQMLGGIVLHQGRIAEMKTGEGKTLVATLPAYLNALTGKGVHIVTVNDYLARRDSEWMGKIYRFLGLTVGLIVHGLEPSQRREAYASDITYCTNNELGFDYLRDNMVVHSRDLVQRELNFAIVDEVDSILIDEARTPLIISGEGDKSTEMYSRADRFVRRLTEDDYVIDEKKRTANLTDEGIKKAEQYFNVANLTDIENTELNHHILQAIKANKLMKRDRDYVVQNGQVIIVDEFTGRLMLGRRYNEGLHQAIEAKEGVTVERESKTLATITFQNFFRMYAKLSGMTGTAKTEEDEFKGIYGLDVVEIPTHKPMIRQDYNDVIYATVEGKYRAIVNEIVERHKTGQPVLVGTVSVEKSEILSDMLSKRGIKHEVLNAKLHAKEAQIVAQAGKFGAVTIATNMAGRGTDIMLGGNPDFLARSEMKRLGYEDDIINEVTGFSETDDEKIKAARKEYHAILARYEKETAAEHDKVVAVGGLHIIGTERHESRRIDNQLRGRSGRQGDPGSSRFYISLEDDLMRLFGGERIKAFISRLNQNDEIPIEYGLLSKQIENAQKRVEGHNFEIRKHVLEYDDVMNQQREVIYAQRRKVLSGENVQSAIADMMTKLIREAADTYLPEEGDWDIPAMREYLERLFLPKGLDVISENESREEIAERLEKLAADLYAQKEAQIAAAGVDMREVERIVLLRCVDRRWMDHIDAMDELRRGIGLRAYGQANPVVEYRREGYDMFEQMIHGIQEDTVSMLFRINVEKKAPEREQVAKPVSTSHGEAKQAKAVGASKQQVGRNAPCPCGSGKKYKHCCGA